MKLITLNIWGGKLIDSLLGFIAENAQTVDIFCFQEVYSSPISRIISRDMRSNVFEEIRSLLKQHQGYFAPHLRKRDIDGTVDFDLSTGLAMFIRESLVVTESTDVFIYRSGFDLIDGSYRSVPRNLQYMVVSNDNVDYLIAHFHGIWFPKTKLDTEERIEQSRKIKHLLSKRNERKILCGDFNLVPDTESMHILEEGMKNLVKDFGIQTTRNEFYKGEDKLADYVLISPEIKVKQFKVYNTAVSDHLPVYVEFA